MHEQTIICRSHGGLSANETEEKDALNDNVQYLVSYLHGDMFRVLVL